MRRYSGIGGSRAIGVCLSADPEGIDEELAKRSGRESLMVVCLVAVQMNGQVRFFC